MKAILVFTRVKLELVINKDPFGCLLWCFRYASLAFAKNSNAKMAVKEMNGIEINGKSVNVRLVKIPGEHTPPLLSKTGNGSVNPLEKNPNKEGTLASSACRLSRARPRQLESEQDSEFPPLDQVSFPN